MSYELPQQPTQVLNTGKPLASLPTSLQKSSSSIGVKADWLAPMHRTYSVYSACNTRTCLKPWRPADPKNACYNLQLPPDVAAVWSMLKKLKLAVVEYEQHLPWIHQSTTLHAP